LSASLAGISLPAIDLSAIPAENGLFLLALGGQGHLLAGVSAAGLAAGLVAAAAALSAAAAGFAGLLPVEKSLKDIA
tara:strand:+ start:4227 stop:4457 length:231 start_codon:yes stop_codon:yes gene_type:complete